MFHHVRADALLMDHTSVKEGPLRLMLQHSKSEVLGVHPVFGPSVSSMRNQTMVLCHGRGETWRKWFTKLCLKEGAKVKITTPEKHDMMMGVVQGVTHFSSITLSHVLKNLGIDIMESEDFGSPIYKMRMDMVGRILNQDPYLYAHIEILNPYSRKAIKTYLDTCKELYDTIKKDDIEGFVEYFREGGKHLEGFKEEADDYSNYIIETLVKKKRKKGEIIDST
jgi:prephenate dehydrogenase